MTLHRWLVLIVLALVAVPGRAQASCIEDISARLEARLKALPDRWDTISPPLVPISGRPSEEVLATASEEEKALVSEWITFLAFSPPAERAALISRELQTRSPSEVDVWLPERFTGDFQTKKREEATLYVEAWLEWAEALGRKDALFQAADLGLDWLGESRSLLEIASRWVNLSSEHPMAWVRAGLFANYAARLYRAYEHEKALGAYRSTRQLYAEVGDRRGQVNTFRSEADVLYLWGDYEKALEAYKSARKLLEELGDRRGQGRTLTDEAEVLFRMGEKEQAFEAYRSARKLLEEVGDRRGLGNRLRSEADVLCLLGEYEKALDAYKNALDLFEQISDRQGQANTLRGKAWVLFHLGEKEKAFEAYGNARQLFEKSGDKNGLGQTFLGESAILSELGELEKALDACRSALKLFEQAGNRRGQGNAFVREAVILFRLGDYEKALETYKRARKLFEQVGDQLGRGNTFFFEAQVLSQLGDNEQAFDAYRSARKLYEQIGHRLGLGNTFLGEAILLLDLGEDEKALDAYRTARRFFEEVAEPQGLGHALSGEARVQSRQGNESDAKNLVVQAITLHRKAGSADDERDAWLVMAEAEHSSGNLEPAVSAAREAICLHAVWRSKSISETQRTEEDESIAPAYDILVPVLLSQARTEQALAAAEEARSHVLLDLLAAGFKYGKQGAAIEPRAERRRLESELAQVETESRQAADAGRLAELQRRRNWIDRELDWNQYQILAAEQDALLTAQSLDAAGIRAVARETGPILLYYATDKELIGFLVPADGADVFAARIDLSRGRLAEAVQRYIHDTANPFYADRAAQQSRDLWDLLLAPFAARLPAGRPLVIVPHGPLHEMPFETLLDPAGTPLFERWAVSFAPSVSTLARARERHQEPQPKDGFLVFSSGRGLDLLEAEAGEVARLFGNDKASFKPTEASFESYENRVPGARHLLISTTGTWTPGDSRKTFLEILPTPGVHDSRLSVAEIAAIPLSAELVALEACDTARGETRQSDERIDLTRAFLIAGAASVLATRWKVPDEPATTRFLLDFYRAYRQGGPGGTGLRKDQALTEARRRSRERGDAAQVWAAWVLVGDAR